MNGTASRRAACALSALFAFATLGAAPARLEMRPAFRVTATPATAKMSYFAVVDESKVPVFAGLAVTGVPERDEAGLQPRFLPGIAPGTPNASGIAMRHVLAARGFDGLQQEFTQGVWRPDQAIAAGPGGILQSINTQLALYDATGKLQKGWPKQAAPFFGLPSDVYMVDPRAAYDPWDQRYWAAFLTHTHQHTYFVAVSQTSDPNGKWNVYGFDVATGAKQLDDFTMLGLDRTTLSISSRVDTEVTPRKILLNNGIFVLPKRALESGSTNVTAQGFLSVSIDGTPLDTLQPAMRLWPSGSEPPGELFASTHGFLSKCPSDVANGCQEMFLFMISGSGGGMRLSEATVPTQPYYFAPSADTPRCAYCLEAVGPMIPTSPVYANGVIDFAFGKGVPSIEKYGTAGIYWGQIRPRFSGNALASATLVQDGTIAMGGTQSATFPSVMADRQGAFYVLFDSSSRTLPPSAYVAARSAIDPAGTMSSIQLVARGLAAPEDSFKNAGYTFYGDFTAASFDGTGVWFASQYALSKTTYGDYVVRAALR